MDQLLNTLSDFTSPALIVPELQSKTASGAVAELCSLLHRRGRVNDSSAFYTAVMNREFLSPTSIAPGWALPHARLKGIEQLSFALARSLWPLAWFGEPRFQVQTVFLFAVPDGQEKTYLKIIATLARLNQMPALLEQLQCAPDADAMFGVLERFPLRQRGPTTAADCASQARQA